VEPVTLHTERLVLSVPVESDVDAIYEACQDPDIQRYTTVPSPYERSHAEGFVARVAGRWQSGVEQTWAIREGGELAGMIGLYHHGRGAVELGYWMSPGSRGKGLLTEAAAAVVDWGLSPEGLDTPRLEWRAVVGNVGSARAARRVGFRYEGLLRQALPSHRGRDDAWIAGLLATDDRSPQDWPVLDGTEGV
jgi:RimJ/RimL family protein N-acetyltransferase